MEPPIARRDPQQVADDAEDRLVPGSGRFPGPCEAMAQALPREVGRIGQVDHLSLLEEWLM